MKKSIFWIIIGVVVAFVGCNNSDIDNRPRKEIAFGDVETRATITEASQIENFKVYAEMNLGADGTSEALQWISLFDGGETVYRDNNGDFTYDNIRYWVNDRTFNFFAVYPKETVVTVNENGATNGSSTYSVDFTTPDEADADLLVSGVKVVTQSNVPTPESVKLSFSHALTQMNVKVQYDTKRNPNDKFRVKKISLTGVRKTSKLTFGTTLEWAPLTSELLDIPERVFPESGLVLDPSSSDDTKNAAWLSASYLMVIPQAIVMNQVKIVIEYQFLAGQSETETNFWKDKKVEAYLPATQWPMGRKITYKVLLYEDNNIVFSKPVVESWGEPQSGGTIIIK